MKFNLTTTQEDYYDEEEVGRFIELGFSFESRVFEPRPNMDRDWPPTFVWLIRGKPEIELHDLESLALLVKKYGDIVISDRPEHDVEKLPHDLTIEI